MKYIHRMSFLMIAVVFILSSGIGVRASEPTQAIAMQQARHLSNGFLTLLAVWHEGKWISEPFTPTEVLRYPEGVNYNELLATHRYLLNPAVIGAEYPVHFEHYIPQPFYNYPVFFQYTATQYATYEHLLGRRFIQYANARVGFECQAFYARNVIGIFEMRDICLYGAFFDPEAEGRTHENQGDASNVAGHQGKVFVTAGPVGAVVEEVDGLPGLEKWLDRGTKKMVAFFKDQHEAVFEEQMRDPRFLTEEALNALHEKQLMLAIHELPKAPPEPHDYSPEEVAALMEGAPLLKHELFEPDDLLSFTKRMRKQCSWAAAMSDAELLVILERAMSSGTFARYSGETVSNVRAAVMEQEERHQEALRMADETYRFEKLAMEGVAFPDPALYTPKATVTRFILSDIFSGACIYATYAYPYDACPEEVVSWSGNYMLILDLCDGGAGVPVWETCTPYDPGSDQLEGTRYQFRAICDVNENGAPEIIIEYSGHEHWGIQVLELVDGTLSLISTYGE